MNHLLLTDLEGKKIICHVDFLLAARTQYKKQQKNDSVVTLKDRVSEATNIVYGETIGTMVMETTEEIYEMMQELDYESEYEQESSQEAGDPDEAEGMRAVPAPTSRLEGVDMQTV